MSRYYDCKRPLKFIFRFLVVWYANSEVSTMTTKQINRRIAAVKTADAINAIEGVPVSDYARTLSLCWARGEITGEQMKAALLASHRRMAEQVKYHA